MTDPIQSINQAKVPLARTVSPDTPQPAMAFEDWRDITGSGLTAAQVINREYDARPIDGLDPVEEAKRGERAKPPFTYVGKGHALGNPDRPYNASEHEAALSLWDHYRRTLLRGDSKSAQMMTALARTGRDMAEQAGEREGGVAKRSHAADTEVLRDQGAGEEAADLAEEIGSLQGQMRANASSRFSVVAYTEPEAKVVRSMIDWARTQIKPTSQFEESSTLFTVKSLPAAQTIEAGLEAARPSPVAERDPSDKKSQVKRVAVIASRNAEQAAAEATQGLDRDIQVVPGKNGNLWRALIDQNTHKRHTVGFTKGDYSAKSIRDDNQKAVDAADQVIASWTGDERDVSLAAIAHAARRGKLAMVVDQDGNTLDRDQVADTAIALNPTKRERELNASMSAFDIPANSPEGRLGMSLVRGMPKSGLDILSLTSLSLNEISEMAKTDEGRASLFREHRVPGRAIDAMADERAVSEAQKSLGRIRGHCEEQGVQIVGPEAYPAKLQASGRVPAVMFLQSENPDGFRDLEKTAAVLGDRTDALLAPVARDAAKTAQAIDDAGIPSVRVEGHGTPETLPKTADSVLILPSGHGHTNQAARLDWQNDGNGALNAQGPSGRTWSVSRSEAGVYQLTNDSKNKVLATYDPAAELKVGDLSDQQRKDWAGAKEYVVAKEKRGRDGSVKGYDPLATVTPEQLAEGMKANPEGSHVMAMPSGVTRSTGDVREERRREDLGAEHFEETARKRLMGRAESSETAFLDRQIQEQRAAFVKAGGHVVSALPPVETDSVQPAGYDQRIGFPARATDQTRSDAQALAVRTSDAAVFTQVDVRSPHSRQAIADAAQTRTAMAVHSPQRHYETLPEVGGNLAMLGKGREVPSKLGLSGNHARPFENDFANKRVAGKIEHGKEGEFVERLQGRLNGKPARQARRDAAQAEA